MNHRILLQTNPPWIRTGLAEAGKTLLKYLYKTGKYEIGHYCTQTSIADRNLGLTPWRSWGCLPTDQRAIQELNSDPGKARDASYGSWNLDNVVKEFKPSIYISSEDIWGMPRGHYMDKPWWNQVHSILHVTVDSRPILEQAYEQARMTKHYFTWAKFAMKEMHKSGPDYSHVGQIYGAMDCTNFAPISDAEKSELRKRFGIDPNTVIFNYTFRNQLRKGAPLVIEAFAHFKREQPQANVKLHFHTCFSEKGAGWDIPKIAAYHGVKLEDILATYVCKTCGQWHVASYRGEELDCPYCGSQKSMTTASINNGVAPDQMRYLYGLSDAALSVMTSGGQELTASQSLLCGLPLACTNYSCGEDFCEQPFVYTLGFKPYYEHGTNFIKATTDIRDIKQFMVKVWRSSRRDLIEWGEKGREWAVKTFSIETIGSQWIRLFDSLKPVDWSSVSLTVEPKKDQYPFPEVADENAFVHTLYREILKMNEPEHGDGFRNWKKVLADGRSRRDVYDYFIGEARKENGRTQAKPTEFTDLIDRTTGRRRGLVLVKESIGDILMITSLFRSFHESNPGTDLYIMTDPKYHELLAGNPHVFKLLPYLPSMEQEMLAMGAGQLPTDAMFDVYYHVCTQTQRLLTYLSQPAPAYSDLSYA